jgi:hypothetical protein
MLFVCLAGLVRNKDALFAWRLNQVMHTLAHLCQKIPLQKLAHLPKYQRLFPLGRAIGSVQANFQLM